MDKCSIETAAMCVERLLKAWPTPINQDPSAWAREVIDRFSQYSEEAVRDITTKAINKFKGRLPSIASIVELLETEQVRVETIERYTQYKPPLQIEKRYVRDDQTREQRTAFLRDSLAKHGWKQIGDGLK